jgi:hypothetical protein
MPQDYEIRDGDCVSSVAFAHGFLWETLWNDPKNAALKEKRKDPNILKAGDVLHIPDLRLNEEQCGVDQLHRFQRKGVPAKLTLRLMRPKPEEEKDDAAPAATAGSGLGALGGIAGLPASGGGEDGSDLADPDYVPPKDEEEPVVNADYVFEVDGVHVDQGKTDGQGRIKLPIVPNARTGRLIVYPGLEEERIIMLDLGSMDPVDEPTGVRKRLRNLGFLCEPEGPADAEDVRNALSKFQEKNSLPVTGSMDAASASKLKQLHGC